MRVKNQNIRIIFGLKVKQLRLEKKLSFSDLSKKSGLSISYLNEIEKGKKYPKSDKFNALAQALNVDKKTLESIELTKGLTPLGDLLRSNFLNELPLDLFGIDLSKVVEIIANAPLRVGAFISTLVELSRNYALREEHFYHGAMRSYQELHYNYFEEIEEEVEKFAKRLKLSSSNQLSVSSLKEILEKKFAYTIIDDGFKKYPELTNFRSVFNEKKKELLLNGELDEIHISFQLAKEIGFNALKLKQRAATSSLLRVENFDQVLSHFKANYFATSLLINRNVFIADLKKNFDHEKWDGEAFLSLMKKYNASPGMFFQRLTNVLPSFFGLRKMFFIRVIHNTVKKNFTLEKELHLNRRHHPHSNGLEEHYCRRWSSLSLLKDFHNMHQEGKYTGTLVSVQRSHYYGTDDEYLCLTLARPTYTSTEKNISVTIGLQIDDNLKDKVKFWNDPVIRIREVNKTCQRCSISDCKERAAAATIIEKKEERKKIYETLNNILK